MTDSEINIAIAEVCGWKSVQVVFPDNHEWYRNAEKKEICRKEDLPDYCNDLNAMHEAEKTLTYEQRYEYAKHFIDYEIVFATARRRAEAFLKTLNLWKK